MIRLSVRRLIVAIPLAAAALYLTYTYGVDAASTVAKGGSKPTSTLYVSTDAGGVRSLDSVLAAFAKQGGLRISRAKDNGDEFPQQRELWRPGLSIFVSSEFVCRKLTDPEVRFQKQEFMLFFTRTSFLTSPSQEAALEQRLRSMIAKSGIAHVCPQRLACPT